MRTKQTERKTQKGLPRATFGRSLQKRRSGATGVLKVKIGKPRRNRIPSDDEEAPACWSDISPSIPSSPEVEQLVDKVNEEYTASMAADTPPDSPPPQLSIGETLALLDQPQEEVLSPLSPRPLPIPNSPPRSPFEEGMIEDLPVPSSPNEVMAATAISSPSEEPPAEEPCQTPVAPASARQVRSETISTSGTPPPLARPRAPTAAVKCPRKEFRGPTQRPKEQKEPRKPKASKIRLTALQEIRRYQSSFEDVLPFAPFVRLVRELCTGLRTMRFTKEALQALRSGAEAYLLEILEKANLACGHAGRCTLKDKDIRFVRRVLDHDVSMGCTEASIKAWQRDLLKERAKRITYKEAQTKEACRRQKLRELARMKRAGYRRNAQRRK